MFYFSILSDENDNETDNITDFDPINENSQSKLKLYTAEEMKMKTENALETVEKYVTVLLGYPARCPNAQGSPYNTEFRKALPQVTKSYFLLKVDEFPADVVCKFRQNVAGILCKKGCIKVLCDALSTTLQNRDFQDEVGNMVNDYWFPAKNIMLTLLSNSDCSSEIRLLIGQHKSFLIAMKELVQDWQTFHLENKLTVIVAYFSTF